MRNRGLALLLGVALFGAACSSEPTSVVSGDETADSSNATVGSTVHISTTTTPRPVANDSAPTDTGPTIEAALRGTVWDVTSVNGEDYEDGGLSFASENRVGDELRMVFSDECSAGQLFMRRSGESFNAFMSDRNVDCPGHPTGLLANQSAYEAGTDVLLDFVIDGSSLTISDDTTYLEATFLRTATSESDLRDLPGLSTIDVPLPDIAIADYGTIPEVTELPVPECASSGEAGLEDDPLADERLETSKRFSLMTGRLPFVVHSSGAGGNLYHHEMGIGLSVRYGPSLDWLAENLPEGHVCVEVPPLGYYETGARLLPWTLEGSPGIDALSITVKHDTDCGPTEFLLMDPQVVETDNEVRIGLPIAQAPYGMAFDAMCSEVVPVTVTLDAPLGTRAIVPASELSPKGQ